MRAMRLVSASPRRDAGPRADQLFDRIRGARRAPVVSMERLIALAQANPATADWVIEQFRHLVGEDPQDPSLGWYALVVGELGEAGLRALLDCVGAAPGPPLGLGVEATALDYGAVASLALRGPELWEEILRRVSVESSVHRRACLYEVAAVSVALRGSKPARERLRRFAWERFDAEDKRDARARSVVLPLLRILVLLGEAGAREAIRSVRALSGEDDTVALTLDMLETQIARSPSARDFPVRDWKSVARDVGALVGSRRGRQATERRAQDGVDEGLEEEVREWPPLGAGSAVVMVSLSAVLARLEASPTTLLLWCFGASVVLSGLWMLVSSYRGLRAGVDRFPAFDLYVMLRLLQTVGLLLLLLAVVPLVRWLIP